MFTLIKEIGIKRSFNSEAPYLIVAFLIAEFFYKFHSFALECIGFLVTWFMLSAIAAWTRGQMTATKSSNP